MVKYSFYGSLSTEPEDRSKLLDYLMEAAREMENIPECHLYLVSTDPHEEETVYVYEVWDNLEAHKASLETPVFKELIEKASPIIIGIDNYPSLKIHGGKGL